MPTRTLEFDKVVYIRLDKQTADSYFAVIGNIALYGILFIKAMDAWLIEQAKLKEIDGRKGLLLRG